MFEVYRGLELAIAHAFLCQRVLIWHFSQSFAQRGAFSRQGGECVGPVEREYTARARRRIAVIAEESLDTGAFVKERERTGCDGLNKARQVAPVVTRLLSNS